MAAIAYWCATRHVPAIQEKIQLNAEAAASSVSARDVTTSVEGRTVTLKGSVANENEKSELLTALAAADGVRYVNDEQLTVVDTVAAVAQASDALAEPSSPNPQSAQTPNPVPANAPASQPESPAADSPAPPAPSIETPTPEAPTLDSPVAEAPSIEAPTPEAPSTESPAPEAPSAINPAPEAPAPEAPTPQAPSPAAPPSPSGQLAPPPAPPAPPAPPTPSGQLTPPPPPPSPQAPVGSEQPAISELAELAVTNNLPESPSSEFEDTSPAFVDVLEEASSSFSMQIKDGTLTLTGDMSPEDDSLSFIQSAMRTFDVNYLVNSMQVNAEQTKAQWFPALTEFIPSMQPVSDARIDIVESQVTLSGIVPSEQARDKIIDDALSLLSGLSLVDRIGLSSDNAAAPVSTPESPTNEAPSDNRPQSAAPASSASNTPATKTSAEELNTLREAFGALEAEKILFQSGSDVLTPESVQTIAAMSALLSRYPDINIEIDGHTDSEGSSEDNLLLSQLRANAVRDLMIENGIARERLSAYGFGDGVPIADNNTPAGRKLNRRIEFNF